MELLYQDAFLAVVSKPSGLVVHRSASARDQRTCLSLLRNKLDRWVYPAHRLDRGASGVLVFALDPGTARALAEAFTERRVKKTYLAVARGVVPESGRIDASLIEEPGKDPAAAVTNFRRLAHVELPYAVGRYPTARYSLTEVAPETGRMHQIRRHMAHIRHPLIGDVNHGEGRHNRLFRELFGINRLLLHAESLIFAHPVTGSPLLFRAPLPEDMARLFDSLQFTSVLDKRGERPYPLGAL
ncbi:MAG: pseudouridylate synthase [Polyangiaceae bacterium]|nr:pseudouridylate synthase [Polyangiaceae bacterium]